MGTTMMSVGVGVVVVVVVICIVGCRHSSVVVFRRLAAARGSCRRNGLGLTELAFMDWLEDSPKMAAAE